MERSEFIKYMDIPCRFKLRGGKEVYGVIVEQSSEQGHLHYFTTQSDRERLRSSPIIGRQPESRMTQVRLDDIVLAEPLSAA